MKTEGENGHVATLGENSLERLKSEYLKDMILKIRKSQKIVKNRDFGTQVVAQVSLVH